MPKESQYIAGGDLQAPPDYAFRWDSSASEYQGGWCYDRIVKNNHSSNYLVYDWRLANLSSVYGLAPGEEGHNNFDLPQGPPEPNHGPLWYGVSKQRQTPTVVYSPPGASAGEANARIAMRIKDSAGKIVNIRLSLGTAVKLVSAWGYRYKLANRGDDISVDWDPIKVPAAVAELAKNVAAWKTGTPLPLLSGKEIVIGFDSKAPQLITFPISLIDKHGKRIATALAPAYIPSTR